MLGLIDMESIPSFNKSTEDELLDFLSRLLFKIMVEGVNSDNLLATIQFLNQGLVHPTTIIRRNSIGCLVQLAKYTEDRSTLLSILKSQRELLFELLNDKNEEIMVSSFLVLKEFENPDVLGPKLLPLIYRDSAYVRIGNIAIETLAELGYEPAILHFREFLQATSDGEKRYVILRALFNNRQKFGSHRIREFIKEFFVDDPKMGLAPEVFLEALDEEICGS
jgi:hypothetical protein